MKTLQNRVAIVTGGSREIGAAMAWVLAEAGASVVVSHYAEPLLAAETLQRIVAAGGQAIVHEADLSKVEENCLLVERAVAEFGRLDIFVANAGLTMWGQFLDTEEATWDTVIDLNLKGSFFGAQAAARQMVAQRTAHDPYGGRIVFSSSVTGVSAPANCSAYAISKAGLRHMAQVLAVELGAHAITVNAIAIGATLNARNLRDDPDYEARWAKLNPSGRCGKPEDIAAALAFLVSPEAAMVNGHTLVVDGGWAMTSPMP